MAAKDTILLKLQNHRGEYLSGQAMADELEISRNAVWKAIDKLKSEGYDIRSGNGGYMLSEESDRLVKAHIEQLLSAAAPAQSINMPRIYVLDSIDSTNNECKRRLPEEHGDFVVLAEHQSEGRGRNGKSFYSPADKGLYMSLALHRDFPFDSAVMITSFTAVCVVEEIKRLADIDCRIKWVNDIFYNDRKVGGILTEAVADIETGALSNLIVGIGIDLHATDLPEELTGIAGALECGALKNELAAALIRRISAYDPQDRSFLSVYRSASLVLGKEIYFFEKDEKIQGTAEAIDDSGALIVKTPTGRKTLRAGEISVRL